RSSDLIAKVQRLHPGHSSRPQYANVFDAGIIPLNVCRLHLLGGSVRIADIPWRSREFANGNPNRRHELVDRCRCSAANDETTGRSTRKTTLQRVYSFIIELINRERGDLIVFDFNGASRRRQRYTGGNDQSEI